MSAFYGTSISAVAPLTIQISTSISAVAPLAIRLVLTNFTEAALCHRLWCDYCVILRTECTSISTKYLENHVGVTNC